ncbi:hypothetical protein QET40_08270 [Akkermansia sp. N21169]|nr:MULTISPECIES: hypothetical protein [unclassified Akkermansia]MDH3069103.1 hypothetical protein [Akkermansia sp. N21169]WPX40602.1 hypothetical protein QET93_000615 [Akkermansia sp. N21116]
MKNMFPSLSCSQEVLRASLGMGMSEPIPARFEELPVQHHP